MHGNEASLIAGHHSAQALASDMPVRQEPELVVLVGAVHVSASSADDVRRVVEARFSTSSLSLPEQDTQINCPRVGLHRYLPPAVSGSTAGAPV